ncbi:unnamed protein product, partial [Prorocentrum cordatum]
AADAESRLAAIASDLEDERQRSEELERRVAAHEERERVLAAAAACATPRQESPDQRVSQLQAQLEAAEEEAQRLREWLDEQSLRELTAETQRLEEIKRVREDVGAQVEAAKKEVLNENKDLRVRIRELEKGPEGTVQVKVRLIELEKKLGEQTEALSAAETERDRLRLHAEQASKETSSLRRELESARDGARAAPGPQRRGEASRHPCRGWRRTRAWWRRRVRGGEGAPRGTAQGAPRGARGGDGHQVPGDRHHPRRRARRVVAPGEGAGGLPGPGQGPLRGGPVAAARRGGPAAALRGERGRELGRGARRRGEVAGPGPWAREGHRHAGAQRRRDRAPGLRGRGAAEPEQGPPALAAGRAAGAAGERGRVPQAPGARGRLRAGGGPRLWAECSSRGALQPQAEDQAPAGDKGREHVFASRAQEDQTGGGSAGESGPELPLLRSRVRRCSHCSCVVWPAHPGAAPAKGQQPAHHPQPREGRAAAEDAGPAAHAGLERVHRLPEPRNGRGRAAAAGRGGDPRGARRRPPGGGAARARRGAAAGPRAPPGVRAGGAGPRLLPPRGRAAGCRYEDEGRGRGRRRRR